MDLPPNDPKTWFAGFAALFTSLLTWNAQRFVKRQDLHAGRLTALETDRVTKGDVTAIYERIGQLSNQSAHQYADLGKRMGDQHANLLEHIIDLKGNG